MSIVRWLLVVLVSVFLLAGSVAPVARGQLSIQQATSAPAAFRVDGGTITITATVTTDNGATGSAPAPAGVGFLVAGTTPASRPASQPASQPAALDPNNGVWAFRLVGALTAKDEARDLTVLLRREDGQWTAALADAPEFNRMTHTVDASALRFRNPTLRGALKITIHPDQWVPVGGQEASLSVRVTAVCRDGRITGDYTATTDDQTRSGKIHGELQPLAEAKTCEVDLCLENLLTWGEDWAHRVELAFERRDGKHKDLVARSPAVGSGKQAVPLDASKIKLEGDTVTGTLTLKPSNEGEEMACKVTLKGTRVGDVLGGTYSATVGEQKVEGRFRGYLYPIETK